MLVVSHVSAMWGAQMRLLELAPRLAQRGVDLVLAAPPTGPLAEAWREELKLSFVELAPPPHSGLRRPDGSGRRPSLRGALVEAGAVARSAWAVAAVGRRFDVLHSHYLNSHLEVGVAGRLIRRPVVIDVHDLVRPGIGRMALGLAARLATATVANSRGTASTVKGAGRGRVHVIHPGVDLERFKPGPSVRRVRAELGAVDDELIVGILGRVDPMKRVDLVIGAMARLRGAAGRARLAVVGDTYAGSEDYSRRLRSQASGLLGNRARFVGSRQDVPEVLRAIDVLVNASDAEPFGRTVLEAQASGTAVIGTAAGGIPELVTDGQTGLLVPPSDTGALAAALERLLSDVELRHRLAAAGRAQAEARFSLESQSEAWAQLYRATAGV